MKAALTDVIQTHFKSNHHVPGVTPSSSPAIVPKGSSNVCVPSLTPPIPSTAVENVTGSIPPAPKRVRHGFSLMV
jgi:hypothetical protein